MSIAEVPDIAVALGFAFRPLCRLAVAIAITRLLMLRVRSRTLRFSLPPSAFELFHGPRQHAHAIAQQC